MLSPVSAPAPPTGGCFALAGSRAGLPLCLDLPVYGDCHPQAGKHGAFPGASNP